MKLTLPQYKIMAVSRERIIIFSTVSLQRAIDTASSKNRPLHAEYITSVSTIFSGYQKQI